MINTILAEWSAITDYRTLRDNLPRRLARLLYCRCVLLYQRIGETPESSSAMTMEYGSSPVEHGRLSTRNGPPSRRDIASLAS